MDSEHLLRIARRALLGDQNAFEEPADTNADDEEAWSEEAPLAQGNLDEPELCLVAWVSANHPGAELRALFIEGVEILYFRKSGRWGAVTLDEQRIRRLPLEPFDARGVADRAKVHGLARTRLEAELTWSMI